MADPGLAACHRCPVPVSAVAQAGSRIKVLLPASGWQVSFRLQADGRTVLEVTDETGSLVRPMASTRLPIVSIDAGWRGIAREAGGGGPRWALAVGHVPAGDSQPAVIFTRWLPGAKRARSAMAQPDPSGGLWTAVNGLWVAAAAGHYTVVRWTVGSTALARRLTPVKPRRAL